MYEIKDNIISIELDDDFVEYKEQKEEEEDNKIVQKVLEEVLPQIPTPKNGKDGKDGKTPTKTEIKQIVKEVLPEEKIIEKVLKKIPKPKDWEKGDKWDTLKFSDLTIEEKASLEWPRGVPWMTVRLSDVYEWIWNVNSSYLVDEIVVYNDSTYFAKRPNKGVTPWTNDFVWQFLAPYTSGSDSIWWQITGTLSDQTDLQNALDSKIDSVVAWINISVDNTDPNNPIISSISDRYKTTSTTSHTIVPTGTLTFTVDSGLSYTVLQDISIVHNSSNYMSGHVVSYSWTTLVVDIQHKTGSGTYSSWTINLDWIPVEAVTGSGTANEIAYFTGSQVIASLPTATYPSLTELSYLKGATSSIQTQITGKVSKTGDTMTGTLTNSQTTTASPVDWFVASTSSNATSGNQKSSATVKWTASGWKSSWPTSARQIDWRAWVLPEQAVSNEPSSIWKLQSQTNNGWYSDRISVDDKVGGKWFQIHTNGSNWTPWTTRAITINNVGTSSWIDWTFSGTRKVAIGANSSGGFDMYMSWGNYLGLVNWNTNSLFSYIYPTALYHTGDGYFWGRVSAGNASYPSSILSSAGSFASKAIRVTSNYTLTVNESVVYADASAAACSGTPTYNCSHWTNQTDCEKWDAHGGCSWFAGYSCSAFNGDQSACESQGWCSYDTASCGGFWDESTCNSYSGCSWTNTPQSCSGFDEATCWTTSGCSVNTGYCTNNYTNCSWDWMACSWGAGCDSYTDESSCIAATYWSSCSGGGSCSSQPDESSCTSYSYYDGCTGSYDSYSCTGSYYTGTCSGTYGASCNGTSTCSGIDDSTNCGFETGCTWSTAITLNLPQITTVPYRHYWVYNDSSSGADVIIQPYSGDQIDKTTSYTLANYKDSVHIQAFYESVSCGSFNEWACTPTGCYKVYSNCSWDWMSFTCSWNAVCDGIGDQSTCESTTYFSYCSGSYYSFKNWYLLSRS